MASSTNPPTPTTVPQPQSQSQSQATRYTRTPKSKSSLRPLNPAPPSSITSTSTLPSEATATATATANPKPPPKPAQRSPPTSQTDTPDIYGSNRSATESALMASHAAHLLAHGRIDADTAAQLSTPWHKTGVLNMQWDKRYLAEVNPSLGDDVEIMDLEKARRIASRRDAALRKWVEEFEAGVIDEEGRPTKTKTDSSTDSEVEAEEEEEVVSKKQRVEKKSTSTSTTAHETSVPTDFQPIFYEPPAPKPKTSGKRKTATSKASSPHPVLSPMLTDEGMETYERYTYYELAALCRERGLVSGGSAAEIRLRLMRDDVAVRDGTERKCLCSYARSRRRKMGFKTKAPVLASKKRKANGEEEGAGKRHKTSV